MRPFHGVLLLLVVTGCGEEPGVSGSGSGERGVSRPDPGERHLYEPVTRELSRREDEESRRLSTTVRREGFEYKVAFTERKFIEGEHLVEFLDGTTYIDGSLAHGVDGGIPGWGLSNIEIQFDGETVEVPERLYTDCYEFRLSQWAVGYVTELNGIILRVLDDGVLQVSALTSDGAGTYLVHWWFGGGKQSLRQVVHDEAEISAFEENWKTEVPERPVESRIG